mgnify:CR=1 FL=1
MKNQPFKELKIELNYILQHIFNNIINNNNYSYRDISSESKANNSLYSDYHNLIIKNIQISNNITYILHALSKEIFIIKSIQDKIKLFNLIPEFFSPFIDNINHDLNISLTYPYISRILTVIQNNLLLNIQPKIISSTFGKIILIIFGSEYEVKQNKKEFYEMCQGFCFYNMKQSEYKNQICGVLCLKELITKTNYYLDKNKYIKCIYEKIILFIDNNNFEPKEILVELQGIFISKCQQNYKPYVNITLYKLFNYFETNNISLKHRIIDVLEIILNLFPYEFKNIKESILNFLHLLTNDKDDYIKNKSNKMLYDYKTIFNFYEDENRKSDNIFIYNNNYNYSTFTNFKKNSLLINKTSKNSKKQNNKKNDSFLSKSTKYSSTRKCNYKLNNYIYKADNRNNKDNNKQLFKNKNRKNSAKTLNINHYRSHYKFLKDNNKYINKDLLAQRTLEGNRNSLIYNLNKLKIDINTMSSSLNNRVNRIEKKLYYKNY